MYLETKIIRIHLGDEWWVDIREKLTQGAWAAAERWLTATEVATVPKPGKSDEYIVRLVAHPEMEQHALALVSGAIVDWNLTDERGIMPLSPEQSRLASIQSLTREHFEKILKEVERLNAPRSDEEQANFRDKDSVSAPPEDAATGDQSTSSGRGTVAALRDSRDARAAG
jgi:hypothetical protein